MTGTLTARERHTLEHLRRAQELGSPLKEYAAAYNLNLEHLFSGEAQLRRRGLWPPAAQVSGTTELLAVQVMRETTRTEESIPNQALALRLTVIAPSCVCPDCDGAMSAFGKPSTAEVLEVKTVTFTVTKHIRPKRRCSKCSTIVQAPAPARPLARPQSGRRIASRTGAGLEIRFPRPALSTESDPCARRLQGQPYNTDAVGGRLDGAHEAAGRGMRMLCALRTARAIRQRSGTSTRRARKYPRRRLRDFVGKLSGRCLWGLRPAVRAPASDLHLRGSEFGGSRRRSTTR